MAKFVDYQTKVCADWLNQVDATVEAALGNASTPEQARENIGAVPEAPKDGVAYTRSNGLWTPLASSLAHQDLSGRDHFDQHPITAVTNLLEELNKRALQTDMVTADGAMQAEIDALKVLNPISQAAADAAYVNVAGDTMAGPLVLAGAPTADLHAASKQYVDDEVGSLLPINQSGRRNLLINGDFGIWQRGASFPFTAASPSMHTADRWRLSPNGAVGTVDVARYGLGAQQALLNGIRLNVTTSSDYTALGQYIENGIRFQGKTLTCSCYAYQTGNRSLFSRCYLQNVTKSESSDISPEVNISQLFGGTLGAYKQISWQLTVPNIKAGWSPADDIHLLFVLVDSFTNTDPAPWQFNAFNAQLEEGSVATAFEQLSPSEQMMMCERYYQKSDSLLGYQFSGEVVSGRSSYATLVNISPMRAAPNVTLHTPLTPAGFPAGTLGTAQYVSRKSFRVFSPAATASGTGFYGGQWTADAEI